MHDTPGSRARCFSSVQCVRAAQSRKGLAARRSLSAPVLLDEFRWQSDPTPCSGGLGKTDTPCSGRTLEVDLDVAGDYCPRAPGPQPAAPFRPQLLLRELILPHSTSDPRRLFAEVRSGTAHRERHHQVPGHCQLLTGARSPIDLRFVGQTISGPITNLTLIPVRDLRARSILAPFSAAANKEQGWRKKEEELSVRTLRSRLQETTGCHCRCSNPEWSWFSERSLYVHASVSSATYYWARPAASGGKSTVQEGLDPVTKNCALGMGYSYLCRKLLPTRGANTSVPEPAPRSAGPSGLTSAGRRGTGAQTRSMVLVRDVRIAPATQNPNGGTSTRLGVISRVCSNHRFRCSPPCRSSLGSVCKDLRLSRCSSLGHPCRPMQFGTRVCLQHFGSGFSGSVSSIGRSGFPNGVAGRGVCLCKLPSGHPPCRKRFSLGRSGGTARSRRCAARAVARGFGLRGSALTDTANRSALKSKTGGATDTATVVSTEHKVARGPGNKHFSTSHHLSTIFSPCHPTHPTTLIF